MTMCGSEPVDTQPEDISPQDDRWPVCPRCGKRRQTACPICQTAGDAFPAAEYAPRAAPFQPVSPAAGSDDEQSAELPLLMCPVCDEAFTPKFYRRCEQCGHRFADGIRVENGPTELSGRALVVLAALLLVGAGLLVYFWIILRG